MSDAIAPESSRPELSREEKGELMFKRLKAGFDSSAFTKLIGMELSESSMDSVKARFDIKPDLIGNPVKQILHGGVISTALDMVGGMMSIVGAYQRMKEDNVPRDERNLRLAKLGTVDMRVDYLAPGRGQHFEASATLLRAGKKVLVTRMELRNEKDDLIAAGTATYLY